MTKEKIIKLIKTKNNAKRAIEYLKMMLTDEDINISTMANIEYVIKILQGKE